MEIQEQQDDDEEQVDVEELQQVLQVIVDDVDEMGAVQIFQEHQYGMPHDDEEGDAVVVCLVVDEKGVDIEQNDVLLLVMEAEVDEDDAQDAVAVV